MVVWTKQASAWVAALIVLLGFVDVTESIDLGICHSTCSAVPTDLWPYCCETHNTCCEEFADSCIHDCLPRVNSGDISVVEERPGLCCALYNLCCFRETPRISSIRNNGDAPQQSFPITHRFSTLPGGPVRNRQSPIPVPQQPRVEFSETVKAEQPQVKNENRRLTSLNRSKPLRNTVSQIRSSENAGNKVDATTNSFSKQEILNEGVHRFDIKDHSKNSEFPVAGTQDRQETLPPKLPIRPGQLKPLNRPNIFALSQESRTAETADAKEPSKEQTTLNIPKQLDQPEPRKLIRPLSSNRPAISVKTNRPETDTSEIPITSTQEKQGNLNEQISQSQPESPVLQSKPESSRKDTSQTESVRVERTNPLPRTGPVVRPKIAGNQIEAKPDISEQPESTLTQRRNQPSGRPSLSNSRTVTPEISNSDKEVQGEERLKAETQLRGPKLLINRQNLRSQESEHLNVEDGSTIVPVTSELLKDMNEKEEPPTPAVSEKTIAEEATALKTKTEEVKGKEIISPIRKIKLFRNRGTKVSQAVSLENPSQESATLGSQLTNRRSSSLESRGNSRSQLEVTTFRPQLPEGIQTRNRQVTSENSRDRTKVTQTRPVASSQVAQENTRGRTRATGGRARGQTQVTRARPIENVKIRENSNSESLLQETSTKSPLSLEKVELMTKDIEETSTIIPAAESDVHSPTIQEEKQVRDPKPSISESPNLGTETPSQQNNNPAALTQVKKLEFPKPRGENLQVQETQGDTQSQDQFIMIKDGNKRPQGEQGTTQPQANEQQEVVKKPQSQAESDQRVNDQPSSRRRTDFQAQPQITNRQRSSASTESRQSSPQQQAQRQPSARSRGRLTARQQLAASQSTEK